jgi:hypothetical protein
LNIILVWITLNIVSLVIPCVIVYYFRLNKSPRSKDLDIFILIKKTYKLDVIFTA